MTAELAIGLPAVMIMLLGGLTATAAVATQMRCAAAAREVALAAARGEPGSVAGQAAPAGAQITLTVDGDAVRASVRAPVPVLGARLPAWSVEAAAVAAIEPGQPPWP